MNDCVFCQIVAKRKPCFKVYEDNDYLGFLDIYPVVFGHTLLIPKKHYRWLWEIKENGLDKAASIISKNIIQVLKPRFVSYQSVGLEVPHAHLHLIPRVNKSPSFVENAKRLSFSDEKMTKLALEIYKPEF